MSFSGEIKQELAQMVPKGQCCRRAAAHGVWKTAPQGDGGERVLRFSDPGDVSAFIRSVTETGYGKERVSILEKQGKTTQITSSFSFDIGADMLMEKCPNCAASYFKGVFLAHGRISSPSGGYFLEFVFDTDEEAISFFEKIDEYVPGAKKFSRRGKFIVYYKESGAIEDIMALLGSNRAAFDIMNAKIEKQLRNDANRYSNCSAANLKRAVSNAGKHIDAIRRLEESGMLSRLSPELIETAKLRLSYPELTLTELSRLTNPPVSKSGLNHRLGKITEYADEVAKKKIEKEEN